MLLTVVARVYHEKKHTIKDENIVCVFCYILVLSLSSSDRVLLDKTSREVSVREGAQVIISVRKVLSGSRRYF